MNKIDNGHENSETGKSQKFMSSGDNPPPSFNNDKILEKEESENKTKKIRVYSFIVLCVAILGVLVFLLHSSFVKNTPYDKVLRATVKGFRQKTFNSETYLSCSFLPDPQGKEMAKQLIPYGESGQYEFFSEVMPKYQVVVSTQGDFKSNTPYLQYDLALLYEGKDIVDFGFDVEDSKIGFNSKSILKYPLVVNLRNMPNNRLSQVKYSEYLDILLDYGNPFIMSLNSSEYATILRDTLLDKIKIYDNMPKENLKVGKKNYDVENYTMDITYEQLYDLYDNILQRASKDNKFQDFIINKVESLCDKVIENKDYDLFSMDKDQFRDYKVYLRDYIIKNWDQRFTKFRNELNTQKNTLGDKIDEKIPEYLFSIDENNNLRRLAVILDVEGVKVHKVSYYKDKNEDRFDFENESNKDITDIIAVPEKLLGLVVGIGHNVVANVIKGENFNYMVDDIMKKSKLMDSYGQKFVQDTFQKDIKYVENGVYIMEALLSSGLRPNIPNENKPQSEN